MVSGRARTFFEIFRAISTRPDHMFKMTFSKFKYFLVPMITRFSADDFRLERCMFVEKLRVEL